MYVPYAVDIRYVQQTNEYIIKLVLKAVRGIARKLNSNRPGFSRKVAGMRKFRFQGS